jgi:hypothetical protein
MPSTRPRSTRDPIDQTRRFSLLHRDGFACRYCGEKPGASALELDHLIPHSMGGSEHDNNLITACARCNRAKGARLFVPPSIIEGTDDEGWHIIKRFGPWSIRVCEREVVVQHRNSYWFESCRFHESDWLAHIRKKPKDFAYEDFAECLAFARTLIRR